MSSHPKYFLFSPDQLHPYAHLSIEHREECATCTECQRTVLTKTPKGNATASFADKGRNWYDIMHTENMLPIFSERVVDSLKSFGATGVDFFPIEISHIESRALKKKPLPELYWASIKGGIEIDEVYLGEQPERCGMCGSFKGIFRPQRFVPKYAHEADVDFLRIKNINTRYLICSHRVLELARKYKWSNFLFQPLDAGLTQRPKHFIDYLGKQWPPRWYPPGFKAHVNNVA